MSKTRVDDFLDGIVFDTDVMDTNDGIGADMIDGNLVEAPVVPDEDERDPVFSLAQTQTDVDDGEDDPNYGIDGEENQDSETDEPENEAYLRGLLYQEQGFFPKSIDIPKTITALELEDMYRAQIEANATAQIKTKIKDKIIAKGLDPEEIFGDDPLQVSAEIQQQYEAIGKMSFSDVAERSEDITETLRSLAAEYYFAKSGGRLDEESISTLVDKAVTGQNDIEVFERFRKFFQEEGNAMKAAAAKAADERRKRDNEKAKADLVTMKQLLASGELDGRKRTEAEVKKILDAFYVVDQVFDDGAGTRRRVSLYEKKRLEAAADIKKNLAMALFLIEGSDGITASKEKIKNETTLSVMERIAKATSAGSTKVDTENKKNGRQDLRALKSVILPD